MERGPLIFTLLGVAILLTGVVRFVRMGHFTWTQAGLCLLLIPVGVLILLVTDYTLHHARFALLIVLAAMVVFAVASPAFCVGLGLALIAIVVTKWP